MAAKSTPNDGPFSAQLRALMDAKDPSYRDLERKSRQIDVRNKKGKKGLSNVSIHLLATGKLAPTIEAMEILAGAFGLQPTVFTEYRMALLRRALDPRVVGFDPAFELLTSLEETFDIEAKRGKE